MSFKKLKKEEQKFQRAKRELESDKDERTGKVLTSRQKRKRYRIFHKWWKNVRFVRNDPYRT